MSRLTRLTNTALSMILMGSIACSTKYVNPCKIESIVSRSTIESKVEIDFKNAMFYKNVSNQEDLNITWENATALTRSVKQLQYDNEILKAAIKACFPNSFRPQIENQSKNQSTEENQPAKQEIRH